MSSLLLTLSLVVLPLFFTLTPSLSLSLSLCFHHLIIDNENRIWHQYDLSCLCLYVSAFECVSLSARKSPSVCRVCAVILFLLLRLSVGVSVCLADTLLSVVRKRANLLSSPAAECSCHAPSRLSAAAAAAQIEAHRDVVDDVTDPLSLGLHGMRALCRISTISAMHGLGRHVHIRCFLYS